MIVAQTGLLWLAAIAWWVGTLMGLRAIASVKTLDPFEERHERLSRLPRVTAIVAARNEEARIESAVLRLLEQKGVAIEVIVVDDRSDDGTTEILENLGEQHEHLKVFRVEALPDGWLGKTHACHVAAEEATGDWLLFTDADAWIRPDVVARTIRAAEEQRADHVSLFPGESGTTFLARAALLLFAVGMSIFASRANRDRRGSFVGVGAFNLVRAEAYRSIGGHVPLRLEVIDDLKLGLLLRRAGFRSRAYAAAPDVEVRWAGSLGGFIRAFDKNLFALFDYSPVKAAAAFALVLLCTLGGLLGPLSGTVAGYLAFAGLVAFVIPAALISVHIGWGFFPAVLSPTMGLVFAIAIAHSTFNALVAGGIRWRGTFYPLDRLRKNRVRL